jgi:type IX secretion system substrate protein
MKKLALLLPAMLACFGAFAQSALPNGDFETWTVKYYAYPDTGWFNSNAQSVPAEDSLTVWPVPGFSGLGVHIQTVIIGTDTQKSFIANIPGNLLVPTGGVPYTQQPTAMTGYYRYNIMAGDTALVWVRFKKSGSIVSSDTMKITGSGAVFTPFSMPLTLSMVPDSMIIVATSSHLLNHGTGVAPASWLELDQLKFTGPGVTQFIPGGSFDTWVPDTLQNPAGWTVLQGGPTTGVSRTTDFYSGSYAVQLVTQGGAGPARPAAITTGHFTAGGPPLGGLPYTGTIDTLVGYYKYSTTGTDSGFINVSLGKTGVGNVGGGRISLPSASGYTYFSLPISSTMTPDTMRIDISSSKVGPGAAAVAGSVFKVDKLLLRLHTPALGAAAANEPGKVVVYPDPVKDVLNISFGEAVQGPVTVKIYDAQGRTVMNHTYTGTPTLQLPVGDLAGGIYFYEITYNGSAVRDRFIKSAR